MKRDIGIRTPHRTTVQVLNDLPLCSDYALHPRHDLRNHSPDGFSWGYAGSGPAQLSLALLADALGDDKKAKRLYQDFKFKVIARLDKDRWEMTEDEIRVAVALLETEREGQGR